MERGDCAPVFKGNITNSKITLNCSKELPLGAKYKLEELLNEKLSGGEGECNPEFKGAIKSTDIDIRCGYPIADVQKLIDDFLINFTDLKRKLAELQVTDADTRELQAQADQAIDAGDFDRAQALIDQIIAAEEAVGLKALEQIEALRDIFNNAQVDTAQAGIDAGEVMIEQLKCEEAIQYFELADESINTLNENSLEPVAELPMNKAALVERLEECQKTRVAGDVSLGGASEMISPAVLESNVSVDGEVE